MRRCSSKAWARTAFEMGFAEEAIQRRLCLLAHRDEEFGKGIGAEAIGAVDADAGALLYRPTSPARQSAPASASTAPIASAPIPFPNSSSSVREQAKPPLNLPPPRNPSRMPSSPKPSTSSAASKTNSSATTTGRERTSTLREESINDGNQRRYLPHRNPRSPPAQKPFASSRSAPTISPSTTTPSPSTRSRRRPRTLLYARRRRIHGSIRLRRTESRGAHQRTDFPKRNDEKFLAHSLVFRAADGRPRVEYLPVRITRWPPGERVYGQPAQKAGAS